MPANNRMDGRFASDEVASFHQSTTVVTTRRVEARNVPGGRVRFGYETTTKKTELFIDESLTPPPAMLQKNRRDEAANPAAPAASAPVATLRAPVANAVAPPVASTSRANATMQDATPASTWPVGFAVAPGYRPNFGQPCSAVPSSSTFAPRIAGRSHRQTITDGPSVGRRREHEMEDASMELDEQVGGDTDIEADGN